ncbi:hypothetical protein KY362_05485 [Candidatus Woesearchaeota archaeon]|nr:hypothetical protein [Candidatus Woesearchaeota archaeon]
MRTRNQANANRTKKIILVISAIALCALLAVTTACSGGFFRGRDRQMETYDFRSGTKGVELEFLQSMPPDEVFVGTDFSVGVKLKNMGAFSIYDRAELQVQPTDPTAFTFQQGKSEPFELGGKSLYIREGDEDVIMFSAKAVCFRGFDGTAASSIKHVETKIKATACYYYETEANADICIDTLHHQRRPDEAVACTMQDVSLSGGQGGPVGVTKVKVQPPLPQAQGVLLQLPITIKKVAGGDTTIFHPEAGSCVDFEEQDEVEVSATLGGKTMQCEPEKIQLRARVDEPNLLCQVPLDPSLGAYKSPLSINIKYYVADSKLKDIKTEAPPGEVVINCDALGSTSSSTIGSTSGGVLGALGAQT